MRHSSRAGAAQVGPVMKAAGGFLIVGLFMFVHVWVPVQAERVQIEFKKLETELSRKKAELDELNSKFSDMTSLPVLDQWAKSHGPWVNPNGANVIAIEE